MQDAVVQKSTQRGVMFAIKWRMLRLYLLVAFFVSVVLYQYMARLIRLSKYDGGPQVLYLILSPYVVMPAILLVLCVYKIRYVDRRILTLLFTIVVAQSVCAINYSQFEQFPYNLIKNTQFFWGVVFILPCAYYFSEFGTSRSDREQIYLRFLICILLIAAAVTWMEFIVYSVLKRPVYGSFYFGNIEVGNAYDARSRFPMRPLGIGGYAQPNGLILSTLVFLYYLKVRRIDRIFVFGSIAVLFTMTGTGVMSYLFLALLLIKKPWRWFVFFMVAGIFISLGISLVVEDSSVLFKLSAAYILVLVRLFLFVVSYLIQDFDMINYLFGAKNPNFNIATGISHDWGYFDVFYEQGIIGLVLYLVVYASVLYWALPDEQEKSRKWYFVFVILLFNFHYSTLNFYVGQTTMGILAAINLSRRSWVQKDGVYAA